jgi:hypothetical protein
MKARDQGNEEDQSDGEPPLPAVSANALARCFGVTPKVIYDLTKEGVIERGSGRLFQLEDSVRRYCEHLRRQAGGSS